MVHENRIPKDSGILSDCIGHLPARLANSRNNPLRIVLVREVRTINDTGTVLRTR